MCKRSLSILVMICFGCAWPILPCVMLSVCNELLDFYCILDEIRDGDNLMQILTSTSIFQNVSTFEYYP